MKSVIAAEQTLDRKLIEQLGGDFSETLFVDAADAASAISTGIGYSRRLHRDRKYTLYNGDCVAVMRAMPAECVDLVVADPPYNIGIDYGDGKKADRLTDRKYIAFTREWIAAAARLLKPTGAMLVVCSQEYGAHHDLAIQSVGLTIRSRITWHEPFGVQCQRKFARCSRPMFWAVCNPRRFTFNGDAVRVQSARQRAGDKRASPAGKVMPDVWTINRVAGTHAERIEGVPTQLPLALADRVIAFASNVGEVVLDPFLGSGTTGVSAKDSGRHFIGIEKREPFFRIAAARIKAAGN